MKITSIPNIYRNLNRWREIIAVLSKYGLANWIGRLGPDFAKDFLKTSTGKAIARHSWEARLRMALTELGPTFIKLGQILSTRPDLVGASLADELKELQANVPADLPEVVKTQLTKELGCSLRKAFAEFDLIAMASASIGQVHRAKLHSGEEVVVKVQHTGIERRIKIDLDILAGVAILMERMPEFQNYRPQAVVAEFARTMRRELDFNRERQNMERFAKDFKENQTVRIPKAYPKLSTGRVLTMEYIEGTPLTNHQEITKAGFDTRKLARRGAKIYLDMIFLNGLYHADPHPGNILLLEGDTLALLDFGMIGRMDERLHDDFCEMLISVTRQDPEHLTALITRLGVTPPTLDRSLLSNDVADFLGHYSMQSLDNFDLSGALTEMTEIIRRHEIMLPTGVAMLLKVLITLEGTAKLLSPDFSLFEVMGPYQKKLFLRQISPARQFRKIRRILGETERLLEVLPHGLLDILQQVQSGKFDVHLDHRGLEPSVNRLAVGLLASATFVGSALILSAKVGPKIGDFSALGLMGCIISIGMGMRLWLAINKSGHLDRKRR
jgi:ubiquinone biosynthesis protein